MRVVLRTEAGHQQGMGDLWGAIALAGEFAAQSDEPLFILSGGNEAVALIRKQGYQLHTVASFIEEREILLDFRPDVIVINKLNSPAEYIRSLRDLGSLLVTMDDTGDGARYSDVRINVLYHTSEAVVDPSYITLRREFQEFHKLTRVISTEVQELLITQGGSDTYGFTPRIIRSLEPLTRRPNCTVVLGPAFQHEAELAEAVETSTLDLTVARDARNMPELMWNADLAITAGGLTMFELACVGTPSVIICGEPFEVETASRLEKAGVVKNLGFGGDIDYVLVPKAVASLAEDAELRERMSLRGRELVDGRGCKRIVQMIRQQVERGG